eukprot:SAG31_NODE_2704_length_5215_cov_11.187647_4_plen_217_part_00
MPEYRFEFYRNYLKREERYKTLRARTHAWAQPQKWDNLLTVCVCARAQRLDWVRAVPFSFLYPLSEKYGTFIARCNALIEKVSALSDYARTGGTSPAFRRARARRAGSLSPSRPGAGGEFLFGADASGTHQGPLVHRTAAGKTMSGKYLKVSQNISKYLKTSQNISKHLRSCCGRAHRSCGASIRDCSAGKSCVQLQDARAVRTKGKPQCELGALV